jgi:hypothetical protein
MARHRPIQLPQELIGIIASAVASDRDEREKVQALAACILVCRRFAPEFRPHLFETLEVREDLLRKDDVVRRLRAHAQALEENPQYQRMVKTVVLVLAPSAPSIWQDTRFPLWLKGLTAVSELVILTGEESLNFVELPRFSQDAIMRLCSVPSIRKMDLDQIDNLPPSLLSDAPDLHYLNLGAVTVAVEVSLVMRQPYTEDELKLIASNNPGIHLNLHHTVAEMVQFTLRALAPILATVWKLSAEYETMGDLMLTTMCMVGARESLREVELTIGGEFLLFHMFIH